MRVFSSLGVVAHETTDVQAVRGDSWAISLSVISFIWILRHFLSWLKALYGTESLYNYFATLLFSSIG